MDPNISLVINSVLLIYYGLYCESFEQIFPTEWTSWASWTSCTRTCGMGVRLRQRICVDKRLSQVTQSVSSKCKGLNREYSTCNLHRCPLGSLDFRSEQCNNISANFDFPLNLYKWVQASEFVTKDPCSLVCQTLGKDPIDVKVVSPVVVDSTPCLGRNGICINNLCVPFGCNNKLNSTLVLDECGICDGDGRQCIEVRNQFVKFALTRGLYSVIKLPIGAGNIRIVKTADDASDLVISNAFGGTIFSGLSRRFLPDGEEHQIGNTIVFYKHRNANTPMEFLIRESQNTSVEISVLVKKNNSYVNIFYSFMKPFPKIADIQTEVLLIDLSVPVDLYQPLEIEFEIEDDVTATIPFLNPVFNCTWRTVGPIYCSNTCSTGIIYPYVLCYNNSFVVNESFCDPQLKPKIDPKLCINKECNARWVPSNWGPCSTSCGNGTQHRVVNCWKMLVPGLDSTVNKELCDDHLRPLDIRTCYSEQCHSQWLTTEWSKCKCGTKTRDVRCLKGNCSTIERPIISKICNSPNCSWKTGSWTECTDICGSRTREMTCQMSNVTLIGIDACGKESRPITRELCSTSNSFCSPTWIPQSWTKCSAHCGSEFGIKIRSVLCMGWKKNRLITFKNKKCRNLIKPEMEVYCRVEKCQSKWFFSDWSKCSTSCDAGYRTRRVTCCNTA